MSKRKRVRPRPSCTECGRETQASIGVCKTCQENVVAEPLVDGEWVNVRGIQRWVPAPQLEVVPEPVVHDVNELIACPTCHAKVSELCKTRTGRHRQEHATRLVSRRCNCGGTVEHGKKMCDFCRADARRENGRIGMQNTRARRRQEVA